MGDIFAEGCCPCLCMCVRVSPSLQLPSRIKVNSPSRHLRGCLRASRCCVRRLGSASSGTGPSNCRGTYRTARTAAVPVGVLNKKKTLYKISLWSMNVQVQVKAYHRQTIEPKQVFLDGLRGEVLQRQALVYRVRGLNLPASM